MKRVGFIYEKICDKENIRNAIYNASHKKKDKRMVQWVLRNVDKCVDEVHDLLTNKTYAPSPYIRTVKKEGLGRKERVIHKPKFYPDQVIHWCLMQQVESIFSRGMYKWSCASIKGRGTHYAKRICQKWIRGDRKNTKHCLKVDIEKYYENVDLELLKAKIRRLIKDPHTLWLIDSIIDSHDEGLPIGNYTSQWFGNFYLQDVDHYIKQDLGVVYYVRYMDDLVMFGSNGRKLKQLFYVLESKIKQEGLSVKPNWQIFNVEKRNLDFCGFVFTRTKTFVRKGITKNMRRQHYKFNKKPTLQSAQALMSYYGWLIHSDSYILYIKYYANINKMKGVIANASKFNNSTSKVLV